MIEQNSPIDIGPEQISQYKASVEDLLVSFPYNGKTHSLPEMLRTVDPEEKFVMSALERDTYISVREGMQIFKALADMLSEKTGLKQKLISASTADLASDAFGDLRDFCYSFATYASSLYISKKLKHILSSHSAGEGGEGGERPDLSVLSLDSRRPEASVLKRLLVPLIANLCRHQESGDVFKTDFEFPVYAKEVFERYAGLALKSRDSHPELSPHIEGYQFRFMDEFLVLKGYEDESIPQVPTVSQELSFQPIQANEIVGNHAAKRKIARCVERMALYDPTAQMNPVIELGGLSWSTLLDGPPGTGKSSMFRLAMTLLKMRCEQRGINCNIFTVDQSIKDEFYGKTGKILLQRLNVAKEPAAISLGIFDDIDLLTSTRNEAQGADNDINNIIMQYMDGVFTVRRGNVTNLAASNEPTGLDSALRNRFNDRMLVDGPKTAEDFADMLVMMTKDMRERGLIDIKDGYQPFATQDLKNESGGWSGGQVAEYMADELHRYRGASVLDFGTFMAGLKEKNPLITGRSTKAIIEAIKERSADFDLPEEWFFEPRLYGELSYEEKRSRLAELYQPITPDVLFQEAKRYFDSEERFAGTESEGAVSRGYNSLMWDIQAQLRYYENQLQQGGKADVVALQGLKSLMNQKVKQYEAAVKKAFEENG